MFARLRTRQRLRPKSRQRAELDIDTAWIPSVKPCIFDINKISINQTFGGTFARQHQFHPTSVAGAHQTAQPRYLKRTLLCMGLPVSVCLSLPRSFPHSRSVFRCLRTDPTLRKCPTSEKDEEPPVLLSLSLALAHSFFLSFLHSHSLLLSLALARSRSIPLVLSLALSLAFSLSR